MNWVFAFLMLVPAAILIWLIILMFIDDWLLEERIKKSFQKRFFGIDG